MTSEKIAVFAPMPSASDRAATTVDDRRRTQGTNRKTYVVHERPAKSPYYWRVPHALTREVSSALADCELTHLEREPIDVERARAQHAAYEEALRHAGCTVERLPASDEMPDSVFIEDIAIVFDEVAIVTRPGAVSRRVEIPAVAEAVGRHRSVT